MASDSIAHSTKRSVAMLLDGGRDDTYRSGGKGVPGAATFDARMLDCRAPSLKAASGRRI